MINFVLKNKTDVAHATEIEFLPMGLLIFILNGHRFSINSYNYCEAISSERYDLLKKWASEDNRISFHQLANLRCVYPEETGQQESAIINLQNQKEAFHLRKQIFGDKVKEPPFELQQYLCTFLGQVRSETGDVVNAVIHISYPFESLSEIESAKRWIIEPSKNSLSLDDYKKIAKFSVSIGGDDTSIVILDPKTKKKYVASPGYFNHWGIYGPLDIVESTKEEIYNLNRDPEINQASKLVVDYKPKNIFVHI